MRSKRAILPVLLVIGAAVGLYGSQVLGAQADQEEPIVREELNRRSLDSADGLQGRVVRVQLAPGAQFAEGPTVTYPAEEFVYVVEGSGVLMREGEEVRVSAGDSIYNGTGEPHALRNDSSTDPLTVVAVWIGEEGAF